MEINSAFSSGAAGFQKASDKLTEASQNIAEQVGAPDVQASNTQAQRDNETKQEPVPVAAISSYSAEPVTTEVINMKLAEMQAKSAAKVMTTADDMVGLLINVSV